MKIKKNKLAKLSNREILSLAEKVIFKNDLPETMKNSDKLVMSKSEFESYLRSEDDRRTALKRVVSIGPGILAKYAIYELNGVCVIIVRTPSGAKVKIPYKKENELVPTVKAKTISFRSVRPNSSNTDTSSEDDY